MILTKKPRLRRVLGAAGALVATAGLVTAVGAGPAQAATCATDGHAYVTRPGQVLFSGFNGDQRFGIPTVDVAQGFSFKLGGNGILPGSRISFQAWNRNTGQVLEFVRGRGLTYTTNGARSNCVVNEEGSHSLSLPPGEYRIQAVYFPGNQPWMSVVDQVVNLNVVPPYVPPPTPNPDVPDVPDIPWWGYGY